MSKWQFIFQKRWTNKQGILRRLMITMKVKLINKDRWMRNGIQQKILISIVLTTVLRKTDLFDFYTVLIDFINVVDINMGSIDIRYVCKATFDQDQKKSAEQEMETKREREIQIRRITRMA